MNLIKLFLPNFLSGLRLVLSPFLFYSITNHHSTISFFIIIFAAISDGLDGYLARRFQIESELGKTLDPFADKVFVVSSLIAFAINEKNTGIFILFGISLLREIMIISGYFLLKKRKVFFQIKPLFSSKLNTAMLFAFFIIHIFLSQTLASKSQNTEYFFWHPFSNGYNGYIALYQFMWLLCILLNLWSTTSYVKFYQSLHSKP